LIAFSFNLDIATFHVVGKLDLTILVFNSKVTSPPRKKSRTTFRSHVDLKEDEERTCSDETRGRGGKKLDATITKNNIQEKLEPNLDKASNNIQVELAMSTELIVFIVEPVAVATKSFQLVQSVVEPM
jgi:hypothetical protein